MIQIVTLPKLVETWKIVDSCSRLSDEFKAMMAAMGDVDIVSKGELLKTVFDR